jgi:hypothetical protein
VIARRGARPDLTLQDLQDVAQRTWSDLGYDEGARTRRPVTANQATVPAARAISVAYPPREADRPRGRGAGGRGRGRGRFSDRNAGRGRQARLQRELGRQPQSWHPQSQSQSQAQSYGRSAQQDVTCFRCGERGHVSRGCTKDMRNTVNVNHIPVTARPNAADFRPQS